MYCKIYSLIKAVSYINKNKLRRSIFLQSKPNQNRMLNQILNAHVNRPPPYNQILLQYLLIKESLNANFKIIQARLLD